MENFNRIKQTIIPFVLMIAIGFFTACEKDPNFREFEYPEPEVSGIYPLTVFPTQEVTITGSNFGDVTGPVKVSINGTFASNIVSTTDNEIVVKIPENASSGDVSLSVWTHTIEGIGSLTVLPLPKIESVISHGFLAENIAMPGEEVWIYGSNFITDTSLLDINFNGTPATNIISVSEDLIKVIAPSGYSAGYISITFNDSFTITNTEYSIAPGIEPGDVSIIFLKNYMQPFSTNNMTSTQGFNGSNWGTPDFWTINSAAQNQKNSGATERCGGANYGKPGMANIGQLCLQAGWSDAIGNVVNNGKMYQTAMLPAGDYELKIEVMESGFNGYLTSSAVYLVAAEGSSIPDLVSPSTAPSPALGSLAIQSSVSYGNTVTQSLTFSLTEATQVSMGLVGSMVSNSYLRLNYMKLILLP